MCVCLWRTLTQCHFIYFRYFAFGALKAARTVARNGCIADVSAKKKKKKQNK